MKKLFALCVCAVFFALSVFARDVTVTVVDADLGIPLEGAKIRLSAGGAEYECDENGKAVIVAPDGGGAVIQAAYPGYENARMVIPAQGDSFTLAMRLGGVLEGKELVIEARKPAESESRVGRSVTISGSEITQSAQIGIVEDVMNAIKLLPGVGFTGMFSALPSIRGGDPGDLTAALDGFYISSPYHWGGSFSIFDPAMTASARLSHGVFSARYGHTISGLLEVTSKKPSPAEAMFDLGLSSSAANFNVSYPFAGKGGVLLMGKITYWDPFVWVMKQFVDIVNYVTVAPYIRDLALNANYRFTDSLELWGSAFFGSDGVAAYWDNASEVDYADKVDNDMKGSWLNLTGYALAGITWNPAASMLVKTSIGAGFLRQELDAHIKNDIRGIRYSQDFIDKYGPGGTELPVGQPGLITTDKYSIQNSMSSSFVNTDADVQWRGDFDWDLGAGFVFAAGAEERYLWQITDEDDEIWTEQLIPLAPGLHGYAHYAVAYKNHTKNGALTSAAYSLVEYTSPHNAIAAELGLRLDHLLYLGADQNIQTWPVVNPRVNVDWTAFKDTWIIDALTLTAGTGLFSSITDSLFSIKRDNKVEDFDLKQNRSWTSILGTKIDFERSWTLTLEGYYKYVFDRSYRFLEVPPAGVSQNSGMVHSTFHFNGEGHIWGIDVMLQKHSSRWFDGWVSYSFNWARYRNPDTPEFSTPAGGSASGDWYWPSFHRFHTLNLVLNIKPTETFTIYTRLGFASGTPANDVGEIVPYPVVMTDKDGNPVYANGHPVVVQKYKRGSVYSDTKRTPFSLPMDIKLSWHTAGKGKTKTEFYIAAENILWWVNTGERNSSFNEYTGQEEEGSVNANYGLPIPMISLGIKWSY